jgi:hypothetical protein
MPIPFILAGAAIALGGYGVKKGIDAKDDFDEASENNKKAQRTYDNAEEELAETKDNTNSSLEKLGFLKASIYDESLDDFMDIFEKIKNIDFEDKLALGTLNSVDNQDILDIKNTVLEMKEVLGGGVAALGGGALAGFGALGGVGMLASASTGTAIAGLSGVAATNATLAWLGGGALSAGGFGMAGGMAVLGGIVAGPVLAVGGALMASKAETAKYNSYSNLDTANIAKEEMNSASIVLDGICERTIEFINILEPLNEIFEEYINTLENIVDKSDDYHTYSKSEKEIVMTTALIAKTVKNICDAPVIDENGEITKKSKRVLKKARKITEKLQEV